MAHFIAEALTNMSLSKEISCFLMMDLQYPCRVNVKQLCKMKNVFIFFFFFKKEISI